MTLVPLVVLIGIVVIVFGGPVPFMEAVSRWFGDLYDYAYRVVKSF